MQYTPQIPVNEQLAVFPQGQKGRGVGRYNFFMRSKQIKYSNDHIKGNQVRKGGGGAAWYPPLGETLVYVYHTGGLMHGK